ncbi:MAG TPA: Na/Pi symporter [Acidimicrobiia bacterium]|nr:Na/Pi symporter [Acidimicrobiia bacterium]
MRAVAVVGLLYLFLVGIKGLEAGIQAFGSNVVEGLFDAVTNPVAGLFAGVLGTALVQSSSLTTAMIVGLVGSGVLPLESAVPMIMGANIGTSVTNGFVSMGHVRRGQEFRRAFAGATVHDCFNILTVIVALPLELATGFLEKTATALTELLGRQDVVAGTSSKGFIQPILSWPISRITDLLGERSSVVAGFALLALGVALVFIALTLITRTMRTLLAGGIERSLNRLLERGAGIGGMAVGVVVTMLVQSSSITTSILVPMMAAGILTLPNAFPVTLGANVGTTITALLASVAVPDAAALTIALVHSLFNVFGILLFYPVPAMRRIPIGLAQTLGDIAERRKVWALIWVAGVFFVIPLIGLMVLR